jgi:hypothetical protein
MMDELIPKLERLIRFHRQRVFDAAGDAHTRALYRLKRTRTFARLARNNREGASIRRGRLYEGMGY